MKIILFLCIHIITLVILRESGYPSKEESALQKLLYYISGISGIMVCIFGWLYWQNQDYVGAFLVCIAVYGFFLSQRLYRVEKRRLNDAINKKDGPQIEIQTNACKWMKKARIAGIMGIGIVLFIIFIQVTRDM